MAVLKRKSKGKGFERDEARSTSPNPFGTAKQYLAAQQASDAQSAKPEKETASTAKKGEA